MKIKPKILNAAIIGAGNIGAFYDEPGSKNILTHGHAYANHPGFNLIGFVDIDLAKAKKAARIWGGQAYKTVAELFEKARVDAISICVPDQAHYEIIKEIKKYNFRGGIIEKPLTGKLTDSIKVMKDKKFENFLVNYSRRYVPEFQKLKSDIRSQKFGKFLHGQILYCQGLKHSASHGINLLSMFGLNFTKFKINNKFVDFYKDDPSVSFVGLNKNYFAHFDAVPRNDFDVFELNLVFAKGMIRILHDGFFIEEYRVKPDNFFPTDRVLTLAKHYETSKSRAMFFLVDNLYKTIYGNAKPLCSIREGYNTQLICEKIINA